MYRDSFERCPRCGIELVDASAARGCKACSGLWIDETMLTEMVMKMLPPTIDAPWMARRLRFVPPLPPATETALPCPTCREVMVRATLHQIVVDRCEKHGVWFDGDELATVLRRCADPSRPQPVTKTGTSMFPRGTTAASTKRAETALVFAIQRAGHADRSERTTVEIVKIGRHDRAHVRLDDPMVDLLHAVIEVDGSAVTLIDLGSRTGTVVNGAKITKVSLHSGDILEIGESRLILDIKPG